MQFAGSTEEDEDQATTPHPSYSFETVQVHRTAGSLQETILPSRLSS